MSVERQLRAIAAGAGAGRFIYVRHWERWSGAEWCAVWRSEWNRRAQRVFTGLWMGL